MQAPVFVPCQFRVDGRSLAERVVPRFTRYGGAAFQLTQFLTPALSIHLLTPDFLLAAMYHSLSSRSVHLRVDGNFIGAYTPRATGGAEPDPTHGGRREILKLDLLVQGTPEHIRVAAAGDLHPLENAMITTPFELDVCVPLSAFKSTIDDIAAAQMSAALIQTLSRGTAW